VSLNKKQYLFVSFIALFSLTFFLTYYPTANDGPRGIHQWAQADRLAVCMRYIDGKSLNDPATLSFKTSDGNVGVEFSGFQYVLAQIVRIGYPEKWLPFLYKITTFILFFTALFFLSFEVMKKEKLLFKSAIFIGLLSSPILIYYGYNFLPDILALSLILGAFYFYFKDLNHFILLILFLSGLSMFIKTSSGIYFISFFGVFFLKNIRKINLKLVLITSLFLIIISSIAYYDYFLVNQRNKELHSVVFLSSPRPVTSWNELVTIFDVASRFKSEYFNGSQQILLILLTLFSILNFKKIFSVNDKIFSLLLILGLFSIVLLFGVQYMNHDYYFIGNFMPFILFLVLKSVAYFTEFIQPRTSLFLALFFATISFSQGNSRYFQRMSEIININGYPESYPYKWLVDAKEKLSPFLKKDDFIFVVYVPEPNHSLVYLRRNGATFNAEEMSRDNSPFNYYIEKDGNEYVLCKTNNIDRLRADQSDFIDKSTIKFQDDDLTLYYYGN
jgi:hypothetical protein